MIINSGRANLDLKSKYGGETALMMAISRREKDIVELLINKGAKLDLQDNDGDTALMHAVSNRNKDIVKLLVNSGADKNLKNKFNDTALGMAIWYGNKDIIELLSKPAHQQEQKIAKLEAQPAWNNLQAKKIAKQRMTALKLGQYRHR